MTGSSPGSLSSDDLRRLIDLGRGLVAEHDVEAVLRQVLVVAREVTGARYAALGVLSADGTGLERFITNGIDEATRERIGALPRGQGVLGVLIDHPEPLRLRDVGSHDRSYGFPAGHPVMRTFLGVPIRIRDEVYGNLYLTEKGDGGEFTPTDEESIVVLADSAAMAIDNAREHTRRAQRQDEQDRVIATLRATTDIRRAIGDETDLDRVLELAGKRARALLDARTVITLLLDPAGEALVLTAIAGEGDRELIGTAVAVDETLSRHTIRTGDPQRLTPETPPLSHALSAHFPAQTAVVVPLRYRGEVLGVLSAIDRPAAFTAHDEAILESFADAAATSVAISRRATEQQRRKAVEASERERARWARELHDETLQELAGLRVLLDSVAGDRSVVDGVVERIDTTIASLRHLITELRPAALDAYGTAAAIEAFVERTAATSCIAIDADVSLAFEEGRAEARHDAELEVAVYRIVQEAVTNAVKHAGAKRIRVRVREGASEIDIEVEDDGRGFDPSASHGGFGLAGIRERVALAGGTSEITAFPGTGTTLRATLPVSGSRGAG